MLFLLFSVSTHAWNSSHETEHRPKCILQIFPFGIRRCLTASNSKIAAFQGISIYEQGGNSENSEIAVYWGTLYLSLSLEGGNNDNSKISAKWGTFFCRSQRVEVVITAKLLRYGGLSLTIEGGNTVKSQIQTAVSINYFEFKDLQNASI